MPDKHLSIVLIGLALPFIIFNAAANEPRSACPKIEWADVEAAELERIPFEATDDSVLNHEHETRGLVSVPLDYSNPNGQKIDIFYRLLPSEKPDNGGSKLPIMVIMNGGPGTPSSAYRAIDHVYGEENPGDAFSSMSKYFRLLAIDQRGTGNSFPLKLNDPLLSPAVIAKFFDSDEHARDHDRVIRAVIPDDEAFFVLARSYGGHIGFQYIALGNSVRQPAGYIFSSALLPHSDALETFLFRRKKQRELNLALKESQPHVVEKLTSLRNHFQALGLNPDSVNFLWEYLGKSESWKSELESKIDHYLSMTDSAAIETELAKGVGQTVNLLNYVLSSAALTPGYTDRSMAAETTRRAPFEDWMLDESWTLVQIGKDGGWRQDFICAVDRNPPPPSEFPSTKRLRHSLANTKALFTFGASDAFLPQDLQLKRAKKLDVHGHTEFHVFSGGHGAAFSEEGAEVVNRWVSRITEEKDLE